MNIADVVSGRAKWRGIQWVLFSATACKVLADQLRALLPARALPGPLHPREVRFKPGRELTAYYDARMYREGRETKETCVRPIAVSWGPDTGANWKADIIKAVAEAERHSVAAPFLQLMADFPAWSMRIQVSPLDARFTQLARLSDPRHVRAMLADTYESGDRKSTRLNSSHLGISYAVFCLKKKKNISTNCANEACMYEHFFADRAISNSVNLIVFFALYLPDALNVRPLYVIPLCLYPIEYY